MNNKRINLVCVGDLKLYLWVQLSKIFYGIHLINICDRCCELDSLHVWLRKMCFFFFALQSYEIVAFCVGKKYIY